MKKVVPCTTTCFIFMMRCPATKKLWVVDEFWISRRRIRSDDLDVCDDTDREITKSGRACSLSASWWMELLITRSVDITLYSESGRLL